ncbi:MAG: serine/threonine-protein kinase [Planctomycetes bacterium]|nr:serine/threonine-protein kinase [Planctomycetota bacterium]
MSAPRHQPDLTPAQFRRVREIFDECVDMPAERWEASVANSSGDDELVARAALELLRGTIHPAADLDPDRGVLGSPAVCEEQDSASFPKQIGHFSIQRLIGRGGMGVVYLATQSNPSREVALKVLRDGPGSASLRSRFAREISVLGRLEHPGIARLYEAGSESRPGGGIAYFSMEYVRGERITRFASVHTLNAAARVRLMIKVAEAVQHAHTQGVIHRDLKPANILVAEAPKDQSHAATSSSLDGKTHDQPKVLDFGVARLLESDAQATAITETGLFVGTIACMSPEQLGDDHLSVDTRSDVYAMGVILYELLTGRLPHDVQKKSIAEAARVIRDEEPVPLNSLTPVAGVESLDRDLAAIVSMAMAKEKERRYATAAAFADDLQRYLLGEPVVARSPTTTYRLSRFVKRNRSLAAGAVVLVLVLIAGLTVSTTLFLREQKSRREAAREAALSTAVRDYMIEGLLLSAMPERMGYDVKMLDVLTKASDGLHERFKDFPEVEAQVRGDLASVLMKLGRLREGLEQSRRQLELLHALVGPHDHKSVSTEFNIAAIHGQLHEPEQSLQVATSAFTNAQLERKTVTAEMLAYFSEYGGSLSRANRHDEAIDILQQGLKHAATFPESDQVATGNSLILLNWLVAAKRAKGETNDVLELTRQIADRVVTLRGMVHEQTVAAKSNLVAELLRANRTEEAAELAATLPELAERTFPAGHPGRGYSSLSAAAALSKAGRFEEAERIGLKAYEAFCAAFDEFNWATDQSMRLIRNNYARWPGHIPQLQQWTIRRARLHLMTTKAAELDGTVQTLQRLNRDFAPVDSSLTIDVMLDRLWNERDQLAPANHPRRAVFCAAIAALNTKLGRAQSVQDGIACAEASLQHATDRSIAEGLIAAARGTK